MGDRFSANECNREPIVSCIRPIPDTLSMTGR